VRDVTAERESDSTAGCGSPGGGGECDLLAATGEPNDDDTDDAATAEGSVGDECDAGSDEEDANEVDLIFTADGERESLDAVLSMRLPSLSFSADDANDATSDDVVATGSADDDDDEPVELTVAAAADNATALPDEMRSGERATLARLASLTARAGSVPATSEPGPGEPASDEADVVVVPLSPESDVVSGPGESCRFSSVLLLVLCVRFFDLCGVDDADISSKTELKIKRTANEQPWETHAERVAMC
jgi:hypothetical protein